MFVQMESNNLVSPPIWNLCATGTLIEMNNETNQPNNPLCKQCVSFANTMHNS